MFKDNFKRPSLNKKKFTATVIQKICQDLDTPFALSCYLQVEAGKQVEHLDLGPYDFLTPEQYLDYANITALTKKNTSYCEYNPKSAYDKCLEKWYAAEAQCLHTNLNFPRLLRNDFQARTFFECARHYCHRILGEVKLGHVNFGPGSSYLLEGKFADYITKLQAKPECTPTAYESVVKVVLNDLPMYAISNGMVIRERGLVRLGDCKLPIVQGCRFSTVPKTCEVDRPIGIEPLGNMLLQKGIGSQIKHRLRAFGLNIETQPELHKKIVKTWDPSVFATLDLASASDTIATEVVKFLIPEGWYDLLNAVRSRFIFIEDRWIRLEKFSSMGNGFTFELETLIFYSFLLASRYLYGSKSDFVSAFGDDMICPPALSPFVIKHLEQAGFSLNYAKTFYTGPFRESCGTDSWYSNGYGCNVRPSYLRVDSRKDTVTFVIETFHSVYRMANHDGFLDGRYKSALTYITKVARDFSIPLVPYHFSPAAGIYPIGSATVPSRGKIFMRKYKKVAIPNLLHVDLACALYGVASTGLVTRSASFRYIIRHSSFLSYDRKALPWI